MRKSHFFWACLFAAAVCIACGRQQGMLAFSVLALVFLLLG